MDFSYSEEQELLRNSVARFLSDHYSFETFRNVARGEPGWRRGLEDIPDFAIPAAAAYFFERSQSIYGGTNEIQRNIIFKQIAT